MEKDNIKTKGLTLDEFVPNDDTIAAADQEYLAAWGEETTEEIPIPVWTEEEIKEKAYCIARFLRIVHPELIPQYNEEGKSDFKPYCVELRLIERGSYKAKQSLNLWSVDHKKPEDLERIEFFLKKINGQGYCVYYSCYNYDYNFKVPAQHYKTKKEYMRKPCKIRKESSKFTYILPIDFDKMSYEQFLEYKGKLESVGVHTLVTRTGGGYQCAVLLNEAVAADGTYKNWIELLLRKGLDIDIRLKDTARVFRLPFTSNCKALSKEFKDYYKEILPTSVVEHPKTRYSLAEVLERLERLPDVKTTEPQPKQPQSEQLTISKVLAEATTIPMAPEVKETVLKNDEAKSENKKTVVKELGVKELGKEYKCINFNNVIPNIKRILGNGTPLHYRNKALLFMLPYLKNTLHLKKSDIKEVLTIWGSKCDPALSADEINSEVDRLLELNPTGKWGEYDEKLASLYGELVTYSYKNKDEIRVPNRMMKVDFAELSDGSFRLYLMMKLAENTMNQVVFDQEELLSIANISRATFSRQMKELVAIKAVNKRRANRRNKEVYTYSLNAIYDKNSDAGAELEISIDSYTSFKNSMIKLMDLELTNGEMKLYTYLKYRLLASEGEFSVPGQLTISKSIKKTQPAISMMTDSLVEKQYITKETIQIGNYEYRCEYSLII